MGELLVRGYASEELRCDTVEYTVRFKQDGMSTADAAANVTRELEKFLAVAEEYGIAPESFSVDSVSTSEKYRLNNGMPPYEAKRSITLRAKQDSAATNVFLGIIRDENLHIEYRESYSVSDMAEVRRRLLKKAMEDSRKTAELIAECSGAAITGIKKVECAYCERELTDDDFDGDCLELADSPVNIEFRSSRLSAPTVEESQEVSVVWICG